MERHGHRSEQVQEKTTLVLNDGLAAGNQGAMQVVDPTGLATKNTASKWTPATSSGSFSLPGLRGRPQTVIELQLSRRLCLGSIQHADSKSSGI